MKQNFLKYENRHSPFLRGLRFICLILVFILIFFTSCEDSALFNAGDTVTKEITFTEKFRDIEIMELFDIELVNDTINRVLVTCGENLLPGIRIYVENEILYLDEDLKHKWSRNYDKIKLELHLISTSYINVRRPCHIYTTDTFKSPNFILVDWGKFTDLDVCLDVYNLNLQVSSDDYGRYRFRGKANYADFTGRGSIFVYAGEMEIKTCYVFTKSVGDFYLHVTDRLTANIISSGNIYYKGNPEVVVENQSSTGKVIAWKN
jgi:hypothetical protein